MHAPHVQSSFLPSSETSPNADAFMEHFVDTNVHNVFNCNVFCVMIDFMRQIAEDQLTGGS